MADGEEDNRISAFIELTGADTDEAREYLERTNNSVRNAVAAYYADQDEEIAEERDGEREYGESNTASASNAETPYTGPRTLDGRPAPQYASASSSSAPKKAAKKKGLATLSSLGGGHDHDDDDDDDDDDYEEGKGPRDLFAGGEKSGLAVQDPSQGPSNAQKVIKDILAKAKANAQRPDADPAAPGPSRSAHFRGSGQTLGGDGVESRVIPDPSGNPIPRAQPARPNDPPQERVLHLWQDGFSIDDGELRRFDDPNNAMDLQMIRQGRAPLHLMNVRYDQPVDVKLQQHDENWRPLPKVYRPFGGEGRRLGSPVPGEPSVATPPAAASTQPAASTSSAAPTSTTVDESQPTIMIRIQMPDGTRLPARFNTSQTVEDVYGFVQRASPETRSRAWVLATTFPNKDHTDRSLVLGEVQEFKRGGTAVVKWV